MASAEDLLADLPIAASALQIFEECGVDTTALNSWIKDQIYEALSQSDPDWNIDVIWGWISSWRSRDDLDGAMIIYEKSSNLLSDENPEDENIHESPEDKIEPGEIVYVYCLHQQALAPMVVS
ncbi:uncharacterized protein LOC131675946 [Topomyia yanbarensis]|uniref:uncharacterized protein LOC131675946 n=1 Tax=Topomyia yanbarensis TaxID=2498891 RepID=UPI00273BAA7C|nr:uncharacterized protein LOC131675946 [Topomyia yanbarensis]